MIAKILITQSIIVFVVACLLLFVSKQTGFSFFYGGLTFILPNAYFSYRFFRYTGAQKAHLIVKNFYLGEVIKLLSTAVLFIAAFKMSLVQPGPMFLGYGVGLILQWTSPLYVKNLS